MKKFVVYTLLLLFLWCLVCVMPVSADSDSDKLTVLLQIINDEGWNQSAVDSANDILSNKNHNAEYWNTFFSDFFLKHPFSNNLYEYLGYPVFGWFDDDVHRNLQYGLTEPLKSNILRITKDNPNLGLALQNDPQLFESMVNSKNFLDGICQRNIVDSSVKQGVFSFYKNYILTYPQYYNSAVTINPTQNRVLSTFRVDLYLSFKNVLPLTSGVKEEISNTLGLQGKYRDIFTKYSILVIDNNGLDAAQLDFIDRYISNIPREMYNFGTISVDHFIDSSFNGGGYYTGTRINIFPDKIGVSPENQFPPDISSGISEIFCSGFAHEFNHDVNEYYIKSYPVMEARKNALIEAAGANQMNYLRSMVQEGYFYTNREEFVSSIANQWFCNSSHVLDLGISRFNKGYKEPINQFIFFADVYSNGGGNTLFYNIDRNGNIIKTSVPVFRDNNGHINKILVNNILYTFTLDSAGNVNGIISTAPATITVTSPNGGESWATGSMHDITWTSTGDVGSNVKIELLKGSTVFRTLANTLNDGSCSWTLLDAEGSGSDYRVRITSSTNPAVTDTSNDYFTITSAASITVTSPNGGESWATGSTHDITWTSTGDVGSNVKIEILKAGIVYWTIANTPNDGSCSRSFSDAGGTDYRVRISSLTNPSITDSSNGYFTIMGITVTSPNGGESWVQGSQHDITWTSYGVIGYVKIDLERNGLNSQTLVTNIPANSGTFQWTIPTTLATGPDNRYRIRVSSTTNAAITDFSNSHFTIAPSGLPPTITVRSPNGGEVWIRGTTHTITWDYTGNPGSNVKISLLQRGNEVGTISSSTSIGSSGKGSYTWSINPSVSTGSNFQVRIQSISQPTVIDTSDNSFFLTPAPSTAITITSPNGGERWIQGTTHDITWTSNGGAYKIEVLKAGVVVQTLSSSTTNSVFSWTIPTGLATGSDYQIRLTFISDPTITDSSDSPFAITSGGSATIKTIAIFRPSTGYWYFDYNLDGIVDKSFRYGGSNDQIITGDWDGDGTDGIAIYRPSTGYWYFDNNLDGIVDYSFRYGGAGDQIVKGYWEGTGHDGIAIFRPSTGYWYFDYNLDGSIDKSYRYGGSTDQIIVGKWT